MCCEPPSPKNSERLLDRQKRGPVWTPDGKMKLPTGYREWAPLPPATGRTNRREAASNFRKSGDRQRRNGDEKYVISGQIASQEGQHERIYCAGESWYEAPGAHQLIGRYASNTEPAKLLAVYSADTGDNAPTTPDQAGGSR